MVLISLYDDQDSIYKPLDFRFRIIFLFFRHGLQGIALEILSLANWNKAFTGQTKNKLKPLLQLPKVRDRWDNTHFSYKKLAIRGLRGLKI